MSADLAPIENLWQLLKMNLIRKKIKSYQSLVSAIKWKWESLPLELIVHSMNNRISEVIESRGGFKLR